MRKRVEVDSVRRNPNRERDREAYRPRGEATREPDHVRRRERDRESGDELESVGYPAATGAATATCRGCGQSIPRDQEKCESCLREHVEPLDTGRDDGERETEFLHVIVAAVTARTDLAALAKGAATCSLLADDLDEPISETELVNDLDETPARVFTTRWGDLPGVIRADSDTGARLLDQLQDRMTADTGEAGSKQTTYLYDWTGAGVSDVESLSERRQSTERPLWLVPALGFRPVQQTEGARRSRVSTPRQRSLDCRECDRETEHHFQTTETVPASEWSGQPIWECRVCGSARHGPGRE